MNIGGALHRGDFQFAYRQPSTATVSIRLVSWARQNCHFQCSENIPEFSLQSISNVHKAM